jgi:hypothetical protein
MATPTGVLDDRAEGAVVVHGRLAAAPIHVGAGDPRAGPRGGVRR